MLRSWDDTTQVEQDRSAEYPCNDQDLVDHIIRELPFKVDVFLCKAGPGAKGLDWVGEVEGEIDLLCVQSY